MAWLRIDDGFVHHPKFEGWTFYERWSWLEVMSYCGRYKTEGRIPKDRSLLPRSATPKLLAKAVTSGWVDVGDDGVERIHDWEKFNPKDATKAERQARWRAKRNGAVDGEKRLQEPSTEASTRATRVPVPSPSTTNHPPTLRSETTSARDETSGGWVGGDEVEQEQDDHDLATIAAEANAARQRLIDAAGGDLPT